MIFFIGIVAKMMIKHNNGIKKIIGKIIVIFGFNYLIKNQIKN